jgi:hypothetical protein
VAEAASVFDWLLGSWTFLREIPGYASVRGEAWIKAERLNAARYSEKAIVSLTRGGTLHATQCYQYRRLDPCANGIEVRFCETGELFERLDFREEAGGLRAQAQFLCGADVYESEYVVEGSDCLVVEHMVHGPRKDYRVRTIYRRYACSSLTEGVWGASASPRMTFVRHRTEGSARGNGLMAQDCERGHERRACGPL